MDLTPIQRSLRQALPSLSEKVTHPVFEDLMQKANPSAISAVDRVETGFWGRSYWDSRKVVVLKSLKEKEQFGTVVFELCNLISVPDFRHLQENASKYTVDRFVEEWEQIEYKNLLKANEILQDLEVETVYSTVFSDFSFHYLVQQAVGHVQEALIHFKEKTGSKETYQGTWKEPLESPKEGRFLCQVLSTLIKAKGEEEAFSTLEKLASSPSAFEQKAYRQILETESVGSYIKAVASYKEALAQKNSSTNFNPLKFFLNLFA